MHAMKRAVNRGVALALGLQHSNVRSLPSQSGNVLADSIGCPLTEGIFGTR